MSSLEQQRTHILSGRMYNDLTPELIQARKQAVLLSNDYNQSFGQPAHLREGILNRLLKSAGAGAYFEPNVRCEFGYNISVGKNFYANFDCVILDGAEVDIGDSVLFGPRVGLYTTNHALDAQERAAGACWAKPIRIGHRVWVGGGVTINQGVSIGDETIIGSGSVVTRDIPAGVIAAGVPARVIRSITEDDRTGFTSP
jgi:maltose O-acetyltransferase